MDYITTNHIFKALSMTILNYRHINSLKDEYEVFLFDLWGVLIEGNSTYPGSVESVNRLIPEKNVFFLSNAPRPNYRVCGTLNNFNINATAEKIVTSGDVARNLIIERAAEIGRDKIRIYHLGADRNEDILDKIDHEIVAEIENADILLLTLYRDDHEDLNEFDDLLKQAASLDILTLCANPDISIPKQGALRYCAGYFAEKIVKHGGKVVYTGKPFSEIYHLAFEKAPKLPRDKFLMIGDTMEMDILGAQNVGIHSGLVTTGNSLIHHKHLESIDDKVTAIRKKSEEMKIYPTYITSLI